MTLQFDKQALDKLLDEMLKDLQEPLDRPKRRRRLHHRHPRPFSSVRRRRR